MSMMNNDIEVKEAEVLTDAPATPVVDINQLTPEAKKALQKQWAEEAKAEKKTRKDNLDALKSLNGEFIEKWIEQLVNHQYASEGFVTGLFKDFTGQLELKKELYGVDVDKQDSHTVTLPDGSASITIGYNVSIGFDGTESAGVQKIKDFITSLSGEDENIMKLTKIVNTLLKPNVKTGMLRPNKIVELNALRKDFESEQFDEAMDIIINAQNRVRNSSYVSGWKIVDLGNNLTKKVEFRFTV